MLASVFSQTTTNSLAGVFVCAGNAKLVEINLACGTTKHVLSTTITALECICFAIISGQYALVLTVSCWDTMGSVTNGADSLCHFTTSSITKQANISQMGAITMAKFTIACIYSPIISKFD
jgi:hypothetical protein